MVAFNQSLSYDKRMYRADIVGSQAYAKGLVKADVLTEEERQVINALDAFVKQARADSDPIFRPFMMDSAKCWKNGKPTNS